MQFAELRAANLSHGARAHLLNGLEAQIALVRAIRPQQPSIVAGIQGCWNSAITRA